MTLNASPGASDGVRRLKFILEETEDAMEIPLEILERAMTVASMAVAQEMELEMEFSTPDFSDRLRLVAELHALAVVDALPGLGLSLEDWVAVIRAYNGVTPLRRAILHRDARSQISDLVRDVYGDDPERNEDLARRIRALSLRQKIALLDVVDRFWALGHRRPVGICKTLESLGVGFAESAHDRIRAAAYAAGE